LKKKNRENKRKGENMIKTILTYAITTILGILIGFIIKSINLYVLGEKIEREALKCLIRANIVSQYYVYRRIGSIPYYVKESIAQEYEAYKKLGGNSFVATLIAEINTWKVED
jgi:hypothetical protein